MVAEADLPRNALPALLARSGMSLGELARRTLLPRRLLGRLAAARAKPPLRTAERVAAALDCPVEALFHLPRAGRGTIAPSARSGLGPLLAARAWSDARLARAADLDRAHVNRLKNGRARPTVATALAIARVLGVPVAVAFPAGAPRRPARPAAGRA
jgi:transcriptional regulator with XRE-family HTH domain